MRTSLPSFDRYLFADYSGAGEDHHATRAIRVYQANLWGTPKPFLPRKGRRSFSRIRLREQVDDFLRASSLRDERVLFGFDHQFSWPIAMIEAVKLAHLDWREFIRDLARGGDGRPALDIPSRYCRRLNAWIGRDLFWSGSKAKTYGLPQSSSESALANRDARRLTEQNQMSMKPAHRVGDNGTVGGQTLCGLRQIAELLDRDDLAWWPFDGLSLEQPVYRGRHVGVEIYPSAHRPKGVPQTDDNDAYYACLWMQQADRSGELCSLLDLTSRPEDEHARLRLEGWVAGVETKP